MCDQVWAVCLIMHHSEEKALSHWLCFHLTLRDSHHLTDWMALCDSRSYAALIAAKPHCVTMVMALRLLLLYYAWLRSIADIPAISICIQGGCSQSRGLSMEIQWRAQTELHHLAASSSAGSFGSACRDFEISFCSLWYFSYWQMRLKISGLESLSSRCPTLQNTF